MSSPDPRLHEILRLLDPPSGTRLWYGGATVTGCLRGLNAEQAAWKPAARSHSIWAFALHVAYWKYAVRRALTAAPRGAFSRSPSNWPKVPRTRTESEWRADRALLRSEHDQLVEVIRSFDPARLDDNAAGNGKHRFVDLMFGVASHDLYHVGQIQLLKRLHAGPQQRP